MTDDPRRDEGFEARARIGGSRGPRSPFVVTGVVAVLLAVAVVKPWDVAGPRPTASPRASARPESLASLVPTLPPGVEPVPDASAPAFPAAPRTDAALAAAVGEDPQRWGMRAIVQSRRGVLAGPLLGERWTAAEVPATGDAVPTAFDVAPLDAPLGAASDVAYALGVTTPPDALPLDIRFWRTGEDRPWVRLLPSPIPGPDPADWLWRPDPAWSTAEGTWPSGTYRIDVLLGPRIVRLEAVVGGSSQPATSLFVPDASGESLSQALDGLGHGPFAMTEFGPEAIDLASRGTFDERAAWLAPYLGTGFVGPVYGSAISGLGVVADPGDTPTGIVLEQVSGVPEPSAIAVELTTVDGPSASAVLARPLGGHLLADGLWRIVASWPDGRTREWEIEIAPGMAAQIPTSPLEALSRWANHRAGAAPGPVVSVGLPDADPVVSTDCSPATAITASDALFGVSLPEGARLTRISALVPDVIRSPDWLFRFSADPTDGLAVVAAPNGGLPAREYELVLHVAMGQMTWSVSQRICVSG